MCKFTYLAFFYYAPFFCVAIPTHSVYRTLKFHLTLKQGASKLQARKQSKNNTHSQCVFSIQNHRNPKFH